MEKGERGKLTIQRRGGRERSDHTYSMEDASFIANRYSILSKFTCAELSNIFSSFGADVCKEFYLYATNWLATNCDVCGGKMYVGKNFELDG